MSRRRRLLIAAVVAVLAAVGLPSVASGDENDATYVTMVSEQGEHVGAGEARTWGPLVGGTVSVSGSVDDQVIVQVSGGPSDSDFTLTFAAPRGEQLRHFEYVDAEKTAAREPGRPGIDVTGGGRGCDTVTGRFMVFDIAADLSKLDLTYEMHCQGEEPALFGHVLYQDWNGGFDSDLTFVSNRVAWPTQPYGTAGRVVPVTVVNTGEAPVEISGVTFADPDSALSPGDPSFTIVDNGCATLAVGAQCVIDVGFTPTGGGAHGASLVLHDSTPSREHHMWLRGTGLQGHTSWNTHGEPGAWVGDGHDRSYTPENADVGIRGDAHNVRFMLSSGQSQWEADFGADPAHTLAPGATFDGVPRYRSLPGQAGLDVSGEGGGCNEVWGRFTVDQATYDESGQILTFAATFEQHCKGLDGAILGSVAYNAAQPAAPVPDPDRTPPLPVTDLTAGTENGRMPVLTWTDPSGDVDWERSVVVAAPGRTAPQTPEDGTQLFSGSTGHASFWDLRGAGDYSFSVFSRDHSGNYGSPASATLDGSTISADATSATVVAGDDTVLRGQLRDADSGHAIPAARINLWTHDPTTDTSHYLASVTTRADGSFALTRTPTMNRRFRLTFAGSSRQMPSARLGDVSVRVAPRVTATVNRRIGRRGSARRVAIKVSAAQQRRVILQHHNRGGWHNVAHKPLTAAGRATFTVHPRALGIHSYRVLKPKEAHRIAGHSRTLKLRVRR